MPFHRLRMYLMAIVMACLLGWAITYSMKIATQTNKNTARIEQLEDALNFNVNSEESKND